MTKLLSKLPYRFAPASALEQYVFGAAQPDRHPQAWLDFMQSQQIQRVCCLLEEKALRKYPELLTQYKAQFGANKVLWAPIPDFTIVTPHLLTQEILPFLASASAEHHKVVVHCAGGRGRTGQVLAAWLVYSQGLSNQQAIATVEATGRKPREAIHYARLLGRQPATQLAQLAQLLDAARASQASVKTP
jgi:protein-tyrosine phosphatase